MLFRSASFPARQHGAVRSGGLSAEQAGAIAEIGRLTAEIRANHNGSDHPGPGFDLKRGRGGMVAIIGPELEAVEAIVIEARNRAGGEIIEIANHNSTNQIVLSGSARGMEVGTSLERRGAMDRAARSNSAVLTPPTHLFKTGEKSWGFTQFYPLYAKGPIPTAPDLREKRLSGFVAVGFTMDDYKQRHPGGQLGKRLLKVSDLMHSGESIRSVVLF